MSPRTRAAVSESDRQFLLWVLAGLIAATLGSGVVAMTMAVTMSLFS